MNEDITTLKEKVADKDRKYCDMEARLMGEIS
jgi:hypothetical protein